MNCIRTVLQHSQQYYCNSKYTSDNTNGNIILDPNGTGPVVLATASELRFTDSHRQCYTIC